MTFSGHLFYVIPGVETSAEVRPTPSPAAAIPSTGTCTRLSLTWQWTGWIEAIGSSDRPLSNRPLHRLAHKQMEKGPTLEHKIEQLSRRVEVADYRIPRYCRNHLCSILSTRPGDCTAFAAQRRGAVARARTPETKENNKCRCL